MGQAQATGDAAPAGVGVAAAVAEGTAAAGPAADGAKRKAASATADVSVSSGGEGALPKVPRDAESTRGRVDLDVDSLPPGSRVVLIGDLHGNLIETRQLFANLRSTLGEAGVRKSKIVFLGDYVDRGPDSRGTIDFLLQVTNKPRFSLGFLATQAAFAHPYTTATAQAPPNDAPTLSTRSPSSESPVKTLTSDQKPRFLFIPCFPRDACRPGRGGRHRRDPFHRG